MKTSWMVAACVLVAFLTVAGAEQVTITGTVIGPDGVPAADCTVGTLYLLKEETSERAWAATTTDADGGFALSFECAISAGAYGVIARKDGFALGCEYVGPKDEAQIKLGGEPARFSGIVVDAQGQPLAGAEVLVHAISLPHDGGRIFFRLGHVHSPLRTQSEHEGGFQFEGLPPEAKIGIGARSEGCAAYSGGDSDRWPRPGDALVITMYPEAVVSGRVLLEREPVTGVTVLAHGQGHVSWGETGEDGGYAIGGLRPDTYIVRIVPPDDCAAAARTGLKLEPGQHATDIDFELIEGAVVEGRATMAGTGEPAAGAHIGAVHEALPGLPHWADADEQGHYRVRLAPGRIKLYCYHGAGDSARQSEPKEIWLDLQDGDHKTGVDFVVKPPPHFAGVVLNPDGEPAEGVNIWLQGRIYGPQPPEPARADAEGRFAFRAEKYADHGPWMVFAQDAERGLVGLAFVEEADEEMTVQLKPGAYAVAEVVDLEGNPVPDVGARVWVTYDGVSGHNLPIRPVSDGDGHLHIGPLPARQRLKVLPRREADLMAVDSAWWDLQQYSLEPGETRGLPPLKLNPAGRSLRGTVLDEGQAPVARATVTCPSSISGDHITVTTDDLGRFELKGLRARGKVTVVAVSPGRRRAAGLECDPELQDEVMLALWPLGAVQGVVYDPEGRAKPAVSVQCYADFRDAWIPSLAGVKLDQEAASDDKGGWHFEGLIPGLTYRVSAGDPLGETSGHTEGFVAEGGEMPMVLDIYME